MWQAFFGFNGRLNASVATIGPLATTRAACAADLMTQETEYLIALGGVTRVESRGATLQLQDRTGAAAVILSRPVTPEPSASPSVAPSPSASPSDGGFRRSTRPLPVGNT